MIHWLSLNVSPFGCLFIPFIRHTALFYALTSRQGSDCKVRTQEAENFDEEDKSLVSAWSCRCEAREETNVLVITYTTVKRDKGRKREEEKKGESHLTSLLFSSFLFPFPFPCPLDTHNQPASRPEGSGRQAVSVSWGGYSDWCCDDDSLEGRTLAF